MPIVAAPPQGSPSEMSIPLLDQVHGSAQVAADHLEPLDADRLLPRDLQGIVDVGDQPVCPVEEVDGRAPCQERLEAAG